MLVDDKDIYSEINQYRDFAEELGEEIEKSDSVSLKDKETVLLPLIEDLKETGDRLVEQYVEYLKDKQNKELVFELRDTLDEILEKIDFCKGKVYELYSKKPK